MVPGIRLAGSSKDDQARPATPRAAVEAGAEWLLIGRTVSAAPDPEHAAADVVAEVEAALADGSAPGRGRDR
jgi:orotidine-5'-phosphate decarboxylase